MRPLKHLKKTSFCAILSCALLSLQAQAEPFEVYVSSEKDNTIEVINGETYEVMESAREASRSARTKQSYISLRERMILFRCLICKRANLSGRYHQALTPS